MLKVICQALNYLAQATSAYHLASACLQMSPTRLSDQMHLARGGLATPTNSARETEFELQMITTPTRNMRLTPTDDPRGSGDSAHELIRWPLCVAEPSLQFCATAIFWQIEILSLTIVKTPRFSVVNVRNIPHPPSPFAAFATRCAWL